VKEGVIVREGVLFRYKDFLSITESTPMITLNEGNTPLIRARHVEIGDGVELYFKYEGLNPTGSFKDRGMVMAVAKAVEDGSKAIMCASTGNTSASAAAYAARVGIKALVVIPQNAIALGKLAQALIYGAKVIAIRGNFDDALAIVREITSIYPITLVNSVNPYRLEGQKTAAFEVVDALGDAPDYLGIPVGNAGNISAYWNGLRSISGWPSMETAKSISSERLRGDPRTAFINLTPATMAAALLPIPLLTGILLCTLHLTPSNGNPTFLHTDCIASPTRFLPTSTSRKNSFSPSPLYSRRSTSV